jgi:hypothetical protein
MLVKLAIVYSSSCSEPDPPCGGNSRSLKGTNRNKVKKSVLFRLDMGMKEGEREGGLSKLIF